MNAHANVVKGIFNLQKRGIIYEHSSTINLFQTTISTSFKIVISISPFRETKLH